MISDEIDNAQIKKMSPRDKIFSFGILYDKAKTEEGTGVYAEVNNTDSENYGRDPEELQAEWDAEIRKVALHRLSLRGA